jgi:SAM-dependent methyltransferase
MPLTVAQKIQRSLANNGVRVTIRLVFVNIFWHVPRKLYRRVNRSPFDRCFRLDTDLWVDRSDLDVSRERLEAINPYEPISFSGFQEIMGDLVIAWPAFTFIDIGSGKGRALLLASHYPFRRIIGIEISRMLNDIARRNIARYASLQQRCRAISCECRDATEYDFPNEPSVVYLFNPFTEPLLRSVVERLRRSLEADPRDVVLIYAHAVHERYMNDQPWLNRLKDGCYRSDAGKLNRFVIYENACFTRAALAPGSAQLAETLMVPAAQGSR